ncbi:hypothetical protein PGB90_006864 [Kerria lacca]
MKTRQQQNTKKKFLMASHELPYAVLVWQYFQMFFRMKDQRQERRNSILEGYTGVT